MLLECVYIYTLHRGFPARKLSFTATSGTSGHMSRYGPPSFLLCPLDALNSKGWLAWGYSRTPANWTLLGEFWVKSQWTPGYNTSTSPFPTEACNGSWWNCLTKASTDSSGVGQTVEVRGFLPRGWDYFSPIHEKTVQIGLVRLYFGTGIEVLLSSTCF